MSNLFVGLLYLMKINPDAVSIKNQGSHTLDGAIQEININNLHTLIVIGVLMITKT